MHRIVITKSRHLRALQQFSRSIRSQAQYDHSSRDEHGSPVYVKSASLTTPRQLVQYLDEYVVGQANAKKVLSVAVFNHYNRVRANMEVLHVEDDTTDWEENVHDGNVISAHVHPHPRRMPHLSTQPLQPHFSAPVFEKSNVLILGPTGSGKTLLARTLAKVLDVPFSVSDATSFTQVNIGEDVDMCIHRLLQAANWDPYRASTGIVYIDEVDKVARKAGTGGMEGSRDVGGEGVQQALLRMMEGSIVTVPSKGTAVEGPGTSAGDGRLRGGQRSHTAGPPKPDMYQIDTSNVLFILSGAFVGLENIIKRRVAKGSIGFTANLNTPSEDASSEFMPFFTSNRRVSSNLLELVEPSDLVKYGFIPEFISRLPSMTTLSPLTPDDLRRILTEVKGSLVSQYTALFGYSGVDIRFTTGALREICQKAAERGGGARGLRGIMETLLLEPMYEVPGSNIKHVLITESVVRGQQPALYWTRGDGATYWAAWAQEEAAEEKRLKGL
ncbi:ClpX, ATPase regulatory subunit [Artomyces pyxidatus]|uniref:ClpX, ATPase regulatory subunit n=1 Tax=Artomyces pyxidatus TaxID=48021 RepID=A0ACB8TKG2_9AGAM|nr:ClpX, ATPase regulatory subunit [Artomyces pyxidatus]